MLIDSNTADFKWIAGLSVFDSEAILRAVDMGGINP